MTRPDGRTYRRERLAGPHAVTSARPGTASPDPALRTRLAAATAILCVVALAGCTADAGDPTPATGAPPTAGPVPTVPTATPLPPPTEGFELRGVVVTPDIRPLAGATVQVVGGGVDAAVTGSDGRFGFVDLPRQAYIVQATAAGYQDAAVNVLPGDAADVRLVMQPRDDLPRNQTWPFAGNIQCGLEVLIMTPSCDSILVRANDDLDPDGRPVPEPFTTNQSLQVPLSSAWRSVVVDVAFDPESDPGIAGLRVSVRDPTQADANGDYLQYGRFIGNESFSFRLDVGGNYSDGVGPVPANLTAFIFDVYPHGHEWHTVCPAPDLCFLGVGVATDITFELFVTVFDNAPAPVGWTMLDDAQAP